MAWQRKIPFGYQIQNGEIQLHPQEAETVRAIFTRYLTGASYQVIAEHLTQHGPRYHAHTVQWNKHMVKRILENETYLGNGQYPKIIQEMDFLSAYMKKTERNTYKPCPRCIESVRKKLVCGICGTKMLREAKTHRRARWRCQNPECGGAVSLDDVILREKVDAQLQILAGSPHLLMPQALRQTVPGMEAVRLQNELTLALNRRSESPECIKAFSFAVAAQRYEQLPDPTPVHDLEQLQIRLGHGPCDADLLADLLNIVVWAVRLKPDRNIELELINGKVIPGTEEARNA